MCLRGGGKREREKLNECGKISVGEGSIQPGERQRAGYGMDKNNYLFRNIVDPQKRTLKLQMWT